MPVTQTWSERGRRSAIAAARMRPTATTRLWLALLGQVDFDCCRPIAPEWLLMPDGWMRRALGGDVTPSDERRLTALAVVWSLRPRREIELARGVRELFVDQPRNWPTSGGYLARQASAPRSGFWLRCARLRFVPLRKRAIHRAASLLADAAGEAEPREIDFEETVWQWMALGALGFDEKSPELTACESRLRRLIAVDADSDEARSQPDTSLTFDTALAIEALCLSGALPQQPTVAAGLAWLVNRRLRSVRVWSNTREMAAVLRAGWLARWPRSRRRGPAAGYPFGGPAILSTCPRAPAGEAFRELGSAV